MAGLRPDFGAVARTTDSTVNCFAGAGAPLEDPRLRAGFRHQRGPRHRLRRGPARLPSRPPRPPRARRGDRDRPGRRDPPPQHALRPRRGHAGAHHEGGGRRLGRRRRPRRVPPAGLSGRAGAAAQSRSRRCRRICSISLVSKSRRSSALPWLCAKCVAALPSAFRIRAHVSISDGSGVSDARLHANRTRVPAPTFLARCCRPRQACRPRQPMGILEAYPGGVS